jgi:hypothetical protein
MPNDELAQISSTLRLAGRRELVRRLRHPCHRLTIAWYMENSASPKIQPNASPTAVSAMQASHGDAGNGCGRVSMNTVSMTIRCTR